MKKLCPFLLLVSLNYLMMSSSALSQKIYLDSIAVVTETQSGDSINISEIVSRQIESALLKQTLADQIDSVKIDSTSLSVSDQKSEETDSAVVIPAANLNNNIKVEFNTSGITKNIKKEESGIDYRVTVLSAAVLLAAGVVSFRRIRINRKSGFKNLKQNINLLREEKIIKSADKKLSRLRTALKKSADTMGDLEKSVSSTAKNLNIAKGELMLAAKIKSFELSKSCTPQQ
ncbi:MAG: hypothetical protein IPM56_14795 [Ignavibacteriales bacterium]|nr:MAG: hypothetical protein IPM56_14795 [Ignavibacteriales bacterium]